MYNRLNILLSYAYLKGSEYLQDVAIAVSLLARGEHLCMTMRGIKMPALMTSSALHGSFKHVETRAEFMSLALR
jgi:GTP cyclohydrolase I